ncbi:hypothetical protein IQ07DRAFT_582483 [Pyrenochaeta sp. DS3sAY3a]|nr:hypothetical protein IQ07DRAFT_582483 [Pyrenochaeta sp. DS3sAY3a]
MPIGPPIPATLSPARGVTPFTEPAQADQNNGVPERDLANIMMMLSRYRSESLPPSVPGNHAHMEPEADEDKDPSTDAMIVQDVPEDVGVVQDAPVAGQATPTSQHSAEELITSAKTDISSNLNLVDAEAEDLAADDDEDHDDGNSTTSHQELTSEEIKRGTDTELADTTNRQELTAEEIKRGIDTELADQAPAPSRPPFSRHPFEMDYDQVPAPGPSTAAKGKGKAKAKAAGAEYAPPKTRHAAALEAAEAEKGKKGKGKRKRGV